MSPPPLPLVRTARHLESVNSTNSWAIAHSGEFDDDQLPALVAADAQHAGRGRSGRSWYADAGTLTFTVLDSTRRLGLASTEVPRVGLAAGLSVAEAIEAFTPPLAASLKWPNDIYVDGGKVAGLLVESAGARDQRALAQRLVIGIGINVSTDLTQAPEEVRLRARSLAHVAQRPLDRMPLMVLVLERLEENLVRLVEDFPSLVTLYRRRCLLTGHEVTLSQGPRALSGRCLGIDSEGALRIQTASEIHAVRSGEIVRITR